MANPVITYNSRTITLPSPQKAISAPPRPPVTINTTITGVSEFIRTPYVSCEVQVEWPPMDSLSTLLSLQNFLQWVFRGEPWSLALDSSKVVDTLTVVDALAGDSAVYLNNAAGVTVGQVYKLVDGPNYQLVTVSTVVGDLVTLASSLDADMAAGAIFRDQFFFPGTIRDPNVAYPIQYVPVGDKPSFPPTRFLFALSFFEVFNQESTMLFKVLSANASGSDVATAQPWFPTSGGVSVAGNTTYFFQGELRTSRSAGTTSHTTSLLFGGTATLTGIRYKAICNSGEAVANIAENGVSQEAATATVFKSASTGATEQISLRVTGIVRINVAGTFIPQFQYSAAPGGAPTILANSYFRMEPMGSGSVVSQGTWA